MNHKKKMRFSVFLPPWILLVAMIGKRGKKVLIKISQPVKIKKRREKR